MSQTKTSVLRACSSLCIVLSALVFALQFVPFWSLGGQTASVAAYFWLPLDYAALTNAMAGMIEGYTINSMLLLPALVQIAGILSVVLFAVNRKPSILTDLCSLLCALGWAFCLFNPVFRLGNLWGVHLMIALLLLLVSIGSLVYRIRETVHS